MSSNTCGAGPPVCLQRRPSSDRCEADWKAIHRGLSLTEEESAFLGADYFGLAAATEDFREGTKSFLQKTDPSFRGR